MRASLCVVFPEHAARFLRQVENERALRALFRFHVGPRATADTVPPRRSSGLLACLRAAEVFDRAIARADAGDASELARQISSLCPPDVAPEIGHHLAVYWEAVAHAIGGADVPVAQSAWIQSLAHWLALGARGGYLVGLSRTILGEASLAECTESAHGFVLARVSALANLAREGARTLSEESRAALGALGAAMRIVQLSGASGALVDRAVVLCERARQDVTDEALATLTEQIDNALATNASAEERAAIVIRAVGLWRFAGEELEVARYALAHAEKVAWELRRHRKFKELKALYEPLSPLMDALERSVLAGEGFAYAALVAQALEMLSATEPKLTGQIRVCERALAVCPGHPNAKSSLAWFLATEALAWLDEVEISNEKRAQIRSHLQRAELYDPDDSRLTKAKAKAHERGVL